MAATRGGVVVALRSAVDDGIRLLTEPPRADPRVEGWPLMDSVWTTLGAIAAYLYVVLVLGPRLMVNQKPFALRSILIAYNGAQVLFSLFMFWELSMSTSGLFSPPTSSEDGQPVLVGLYLEVDGVCGYRGHGTYSNLVNNLVHVFMYSYYLMSAMGPEYSKYLWWKKYLTAIQMAQFALVFVHSAQVLFINCGYPRIVATFLLLHSLIFFGLFLDFYCAAHGLLCLNWNYLLLGFTKYANVTNKLLIQKKVLAKKQ